MKIFSSYLRTGGLPKEEGRGGREGRRGEGEERGGKMEWSRREKEERYERVSVAVWYEDMPGVKGIR